MWQQRNPTSRVLTERFGRLGRTSTNASVRTCYSCNFSRLLTSMCDIDGGGRLWTGPGVKRTSPRRTSRKPPRQRGEPCDYLRAVAGSIPVAPTAEGRPCSVASPLSRMSAVDDFGWPSPQAPHGAVGPDPAWSRWFGLASLGRLGVRLVRLAMRRCARAPHCGVARCDGLRELGSWLTSGDHGEWLGEHRSLSGTGRGRAVFCTGCRGRLGPPPPKDDYL
ncbi:hypothetical protein LX90_007519 [Lentzea flava]|nr:hypothetical protein [Lentzea flava]